MKKPLIFGSGASSFKDQKGLYSVCKIAISNDILCFDTAPSYGTEEVLSRCLLALVKEKELSREDLTIQTKIDPIQMYNGDVEEYFTKKLASMGLEYIDVLLVHWPVYKYFKKTWDSMQNLKHAGLAKRIGICNLRFEHLKELKGQGIVPEVLQIERHPLNTFEAERNYCVEHQIDLQDYSPLCKMHPLLKESPVLKQLSEKYNKSIGNIILRWHIDTGAIPIFTSKNITRIEDYASVNSYTMSSEDIEKIDSLNINHKLYLESLVCPGF